MNIWDILLSAEALAVVFKLGFIPKKEELYEFTPEQYEKYYETENKEPTGEKIFMLLPDDIKKYNEFAAEDVYIFMERDIAYFEKAKRAIDRYCANSDMPLETFEDKLRHTASLLPSVFSEGTNYNFKAIKRSQFNIIKK
jgi:hypothetical protein